MKKMLVVSFLSIAGIVYASQRVTAVQATQNLTQAAPTDAGQGVALTQPAGPCKAVQFTYRGKADAGSTSNDNNVSGGNFDAYKFSPQLGWTRDPAGDRVALGDGGLGSDRAVTLAGHVPPVQGNDDRYFYAARGVAVVSNDGGAVLDTLLECQF